MWGLISDLEPPEDLVGMTGPDSATYETQEAFRESLSPGWGATGNLPNG